MRQLNFFAVKVAGKMRGAKKIRYFAWRGG
jgi:hypothetical protein